MFVDDLRVQPGEPAVVRILCRATVAHVDQLAFVLKHGDQAAHFAGAHRRAAHAAVTDFYRYDLRTWGEAVEFRFIRVIGRDDPGHVRAVRADIGDDRECVAVVVDVEREVHHRLFAEGRPLPFGTEIGHQFFVAKIAVLVGVHSGAPCLAVVENDAVINRAGIAVAAIERGEQVDLCLQLGAFLFRVALGGGMFFVELSELGLQVRRPIALPLVPLLFAL